jgi:uncharacterized phage protein (TIGR02218 family)
MKSVSSAFMLRLQEDNINLCELIDLELPGGVKYHWTTANAPITYTLSGAPTVYGLFQGTTPRGVEESLDLGVSVLNFAMVNTHSDIRGMMQSDDFKTATVKVGRVFIDTPDLGRMPVFHGDVGAFSHNRLTISGEVRNVWKSLALRWPYYSFQDNCNWRFGSPGCGFDTSSITVAMNSINVASSTTLNILVASGYVTQSYGNGRFDFGRITISAGANSGHIRTIRVQTGDLLKLSHPLPINSLAGMQFIFNPGCRKQLERDCQSLYNNARNFFGFPWIPVQEHAFLTQ